jgi:hypothetical protein
MSTKKSWADIADEEDRKTETVNFSKHGIKVYVPPRLRDKSKTCENTKTDELPSVSRNVHKSL